MGPNPQFPADLVTFTEDTEEILNGKLHFLCSVNGIFNTALGIQIALF